ncbi:MAG TPA: ABC transporter ATP-binding protein [Candidatus Avalokitesvara rifleensis]|uniref:ABC transporter ATP-binding protein n=1 Tax=Candidatus Avalokitesvara rifleensis TaxID=3367620 RepID=UPI002712FB7E|nr:ATP-binding cassette domain-containing protein [Candidatus Brocadiales bacterium]
MIKVENLTKRYADKLAVDNISFEVQEGEVLGFLGPNGAGKSTTMRILTCFIPATSGFARVAGNDVFTDSLKVREQIGYLPENVPLYLDMRVNEYLMFRAELKKVPRRERRSKMGECLERCGIVDVQNQMVGTLSKGYRQRVGLADVLIHNPKILVLDEPTIGLDPNQIRQVRQLIKELGEKHTILLSTHILPEVEMICGRVIIIDKGKLVANDTPVNLLAKLKGGTILKLQAKGPAQPMEKAVKDIAGVTKVEVKAGDNTVKDFVVEAEKGKDVREDIFKTFVKNNWVLLEMRKEAVTLEDVFHQLTTKEEYVTTEEAAPGNVGAGIGRMVSGMFGKKS